MCARAGGYVCVACARGRGLACVHECAYASVRLPSLLVRVCVRVLAYVQACACVSVSAWTSVHTRDHVVVCERVKVRKGMPTCARVRVCGYARAHARLSAPMCTPVHTSPRVHVLATRACTCSSSLAHSSLRARTVSKRKPFLICECSYR
eukprot:6205640-Pleurochrysis_carterae.AAC.2